MEHEGRATPSVDPVSGALRPTGGRDREPILDVLRGFALLGILLVNIELMRGADLYRVLAGTPVEPESGADAVLHFLTGWLVAGKFLSSFAIMFGIGAALIAMRSWRLGRSPRGLLLRRYGLLLLLGLVHMVLAFPGDILFAYGLAGLVLLAFVGVRAGTALWWAAGILAVLLALGLGLTALGVLGPDAAGGDPAAGGFFDERREQAVSAYHEGTYRDVLVANAWQALVVQSSTVILLPWIVALFLVGYAIGRSGMLADLAAHRHRLRVAMVAGLAAGLPLNVATGFLGPLSLGSGVQPDAAGSTIALVAMLGQVVGAPLLAVGYLAAVALLCLRIGPLRPLAATGRMALTAYLLQSVLALVVFAGLDLYDRLGPTEGLLVVAGIWAVLLVACPLWMRHFRFGPVEWLWRSLTYGARQPLRARSA